MYNCSNGLCNRQTCNWCIVQGKHGPILAMDIKSPLFTLKQIFLCANMNVQDIYKRKDYCISKCACSYKPKCISEKNDKHLCPDMTATQIL